MPVLVGTGGCYSGTQYRSMATWQRGLLLRRGAQALAAAGLEAPRRTARWLLESALEVPAAQLVAYPAQAVNADAAATFWRYVDRCRCHEPLQYVLGYADFFGLRLQVSPDVLIPRTETELLVHQCLSRLAGHPRPRVLDVGTGSGCIALAIKTVRSDAHVTGIDVSAAALRVAEANALALESNVELLLLDVLTERERLASFGPFDHIVSNPPYIPDAELAVLPRSVRDFEPRIAMACGDDPMRFYRALAALKPLLKGGGSLAVEVHADYASATHKLIAAAGFDKVRIANDLADLPRTVTGIHKGP